VLYYDHHIFEFDLSSLLAQTRKALKKQKTEIILKSDRRTIILESDPIPMGRL